MKATKSYLGNKEQNAMFSVVSRSGAHFCSTRPLFAWHIVRGSKISDPKIRCGEIKFY